MFFIVVVIAVVALDFSFFWPFVYIFIFGHPLLLLFGVLVNWSKMRFDVPVTRCPRTFRTPTGKKNEPPTQAATQPPTGLLLCVIVLYVPLRTQLSYPLCGFFILDFFIFFFLSPPRKWNHVQWFFLLDPSPDVVGIFFFFLRLPLMWTACANICNFITHSSTHK